MVVSNLYPFTVISASLGDNLDGTINALVAIEGYCSSVFKNDNMVYFLWADKCDVTLYTINHDKWCTGA